VHYLVSNCSQQSEDGCGPKSTITAANDRRNIANLSLLVHEMKPYLPPQHQTLFLLNVGIYLPPHGGSAEIADRLDIAGLDIHSFIFV